jgi:23S rRNA G2445 N2-methylase RlmL
VRFFATCSRGTEGALRRELAALRLPAVRGDRGGVAFEGRLEHGMRACLWSRTAMRVLLELGRFPAADAAALYAGARTVPWADWLSASSTLAVEASVTSSAITHSGFAALKVKDAVVDALRDRLGARPDVDPKDPDVRVVLHLARDQASLSLDLAGEPLHRRGWRTAVTEAPLKETLAAAVLSLGRVPADQPFVDPMCGSGTLCIEQALAARRLAPGLSRAFGFQRWPGHRGARQSAWDRMKEEARASALPRAPAPIAGRDHSAKALEAARRNASAAGVAGDVVFEGGDARDLRPAGPEGTLCFNPPYGERLASRPLQLGGLYRGLAEMLRRHGGWTAVILSGSPLLERAVGLRPQVTHRLWNGPLEVRLLRYRIPRTA